MIGKSSTAASIVVAVITAQPHALCRTTNKRQDHQQGRHIGLHIIPLHATKQPFLYFVSLPLKRVFAYGLRLPFTTFYTIQSHVRLRSASISKPTDQLCSFRSD
jgi:hypothetical protein